MTIIARSASRSAPSRRSFRKTKCPAAKSISSRSTNNRPESGRCWPRRSRRRRMRRNGMGCRTSLRKDLRTTPRLIAIKFRTCDERYSTARALSSDPTVTLREPSAMNSKPSSVPTLGGRAPRRWLITLPSGSIARISPRCPAAQAWQAPCSVSSTSPTAGTRPFRSMGVCPRARSLLLPARGGVW